jgi:hypothetical protein
MKMMVKKIRENLTNKRFYYRNKIKKLNEEIYTQKKT